jgi:hypothetical protein
MGKYRGADKSLARPRRKQATAKKILMFIYPIYNKNNNNNNNNNGGILVLFLYITKLASKEIFSPSNKIHRK